MVEGLVRTTISRIAVAKLAADLAELVHGESKPVPLPPERELVKKFGLSRRAVRLAVDLLEKRNLVERRHGSGNYLLPKKIAVNSVYLIIPKEIKAEEPFYSSLIGQMMLYARRHRITLIPEQIDGDNLLWNKELPGILLAGIPNKQVRCLASQLRSLIVLAEQDSDACCQVVFDDFAIGREAARKFWDFGHRRVLILSGPDVYASARLRKEGFIEEAGNLGLHVGVMEGKMNWRGGFDLMSQYLSNLHTQSRPTGIFASNDWMAAGALHAINARGLRVPHDFSLIGCDDVPLASQLEPALATFKIDISLFVEQAFLTLEQAWRLQLPKKIVLPAAFVHRDSLGRSHVHHG